MQEDLLVLCAIRSLSSVIQVSVTPQLWTCAQGPKKNRPRSIQTNQNQVDQKNTIPPMAHGLFSSGTWPDVGCAWWEQNLNHHSFHKPCSLCVGLPAGSSVQCRRGSSSWHFSDLHRYPCDTSGSSSWHFSDLYRYPCDTSHLEPSHRRAVT